jgi:hypothetical protein
LRWRRILDRANATINRHDAKSSRVFALSTATRKVVSVRANRAIVVALHSPLSGTLGLNSERFDADYYAA